jgi:hypothetical protein
MPACAERRATQGRQGLQARCFAELSYAKSPSHELPSHQHANPAIMLSPLTNQEAVVVHELVHLHESDHSPAFWQRLERVMPDYEQRKRWLAENGMNVEGI